jgi:hypothetical protein
MMVLLYLVRHTLQNLTIESKWDIVVACPLNGDQTFTPFGTSTSLTNFHPLMQFKTKTEPYYFFFTIHMPISP